MSALVIVVCHDCNWRSDPVPPDRVEVGPGGITVQAAGTPMQHALTAHVIEEHLPIEHAWLEGRDWEVVPHDR